VHLEARGEGLAAALRKVPGVGRVAVEQGSQWLVEADQDVRPALVRAAHDAGAEIRSVQIERPGLDEVYANYFRSPSVGATA